MVEIKDIIKVEEINIIKKSELDLDKLAFAIAMSETNNCKLWYWKTYNNCFWIKNWNTAPCKRIWNNGGKLLVQH